MKAVIMAGGEGTRLRPLTSNQPKPMLPMANIPMMEHVVNLLRTHGFEDIVVTVAFMANAIRTYFGDGSEFGVRMVYATESTPLGTAGSVRNAKDELDERFLVISGDVLTDIDLGRVVDFHADHGGIATLALKAVENPLEFGIVITDEDGAIERFLEKPTWGQVFSDTINTGIYVLEPEIFDFIPEGQAVDFSGESFPAALAAGRGLYGYVADGYWEDVGTLEAYLSSHQDILDRQVQVDIDGFPLRPGVWVGKGAEIDPSVVVTGPAVIGDNCVVGPGARLGAYCTLGRNVRIGDNAVVERSVVHDNTYLGSGVRVEGSVLGRGSDLRQGVRCEEGVVLGDECFVGRPRRDQRRGQDLPVQDGRGRGHRQLVDRVGVPGRPLAVRPRRGAGPGQRRHQPRAGRAALDGLGLDAGEGRHGHQLRATPAGPAGCSSGRSWSAATRPGVNVDDLEAATVPVTRFQITSSSIDGRGHRAPGPPRPPVGRAPVLRQGRHRRRRGDPAQDRAPVPPGGLPPGPGPRRSVTSGSRPAPSSTTPRPSSTRSTCRRPARPASSWCSTTPSARPASSCPPCWPSSRPRCWWSTRTPTRPACSPSTGQAAAARVSELVRASGAHLGAVLDPGGEFVDIVDDLGHTLSHDEALLVLVTLVTEAVPGARIALPVAASGAAERICQDAGAEIVWTKLSASHLMEVARSEKVTLAASQSGGFIFPAFLPAFDGGGHPGQPHRPAVRHRAEAVRAGGGHAARCASPTSRSTRRGTRRGC